MYVIVLSVNYKQVSVEEREKVSFQDSQLPDALHTLRTQKSILEACLLSTCNRTEVYVVADQLHTGKYYSQQFLANYFGLELDAIKRITTVRTEDEAIEHLFRVTAGLDSMVLGETQILGQIRDAFLLAQVEGTTGTVFNRLFQNAITIAKRGHHETEISKNSISISYAAIEHIKSQVDDITNKRILVVGAGDMAEQSLLNLSAAGAKDVIVLNRTVENAAKLAGQFGYQSASLNDIEELLVDADIVVSSTAAEDFVITKDMVPNDRKQRLLMDIALPRDIEPEISELAHVTLFNVDDLEHIIDENLALRKNEANKIEEMIVEAMDTFKEWVNMLGVVPVIQAMRSRALDIQESTFESLNRKLPDLNEREKKVISKHMKSIINQMLKDPIMYTKELSDQPNRKLQLAEIEKMFNIEDRVHELKEEEKKKLEKVLTNVL